MSGIAGIACPGKKAPVKRMLDRITHRGPAGNEIIETESATLGIVWTELQESAISDLKHRKMACDNSSTGRFAEAQATANGLVLKRDRLGVAPLYYGRTEDGNLCFASEIKALLEITQDLHEFPPGQSYDGEQFERYYQLSPASVLEDPPERLAEGLRQRLETAVEKRIAHEEMGAWLSGGLDSSALAALARPHVSHFHTFAAGIPGAPDLEHARAVAEFIQSDHHEVVVGLQDMLAVLPQVIYHLESFDALLVRSSITNFLVARLAAEYVPAVFSGEGGDELFAGYAYLKKLRLDSLARELVDITGRLHNTALQRVDRSAAAHGTVAYVGLLDPEVVDYAMGIPARYKLHNGMEKWILRRAVSDVLPRSVVRRPKAKFWEGAGVSEMLAEQAEELISDAEFDQQRVLPNGWQLSTKEEFWYYQIFRDHYGDLENMAWMGRTKGAPVQ